MLEYGCGTGLLSSALQADRGEVTLADCSPGMLTVLEEKISAAGLTHLHPLALDLTTDPLPAERYDLIYTLMTLHHVANTTRLLCDFYNLSDFAYGVPRPKVGILFFLTMAFTIMLLFPFSLT